MKTISRRSSPMRLILACGLMLTLVSISGIASPAPAAAVEGRPLALLEPASGAYFGVNLDWATDSVAKFSTRFGRTPMVFVRFFRFPFDKASLIQLEDFVSQVEHYDAIAMVTLEPLDGLAAVTPAVAEDLATRMEAYNRAGVPIMIRFAHEMNGSWYPWSQRPALYRSTFRLVADAVHRRAPQTSMLWAPNYGAGYPFHGGLYEAQPGSAEFTELDTNKDTVLGMADDMYAPYYPGDDVVDWVGMSLYHWGNTYPWGENEIPEANKFIQQVHGGYSGLNGDESAVPDFYDEYVNGHGKPMAIPETAALYNTTTGGASPLLIKRTWWRQVFDADVRAELPGIKLISWFEWRKPESEIGGAVIDWTITSDPAVLQQFREDLPPGTLIFAGEGQQYRTYVPLVAAP